MEARSIEIINIDNKGEISSLEKRRAFEEAVGFIETSKGTLGKVLILYGLRRTGKTILMKQLALKYGVDYIYQVGKNTLMNDVYKVLEKEHEAGARIVFIDEITNARDFIVDSALLADKYACYKMDIVLAGTDSLGFYLAEGDALFDRTYKIPMSYISFAEHSSVVNSVDIDEYIRYGGLMREDKLDAEAITDIVTAKRFLDSAVAGNIVSSLKKSVNMDGCGVILEYTEEDIKFITQKLVEIYNGQMVAEIINNEYLKPSIDAPIADKIKNLKRLQIPVEKYSTLNRDELRKEYVDRVNLNHQLSKPTTVALMNALETLYNKLNILSYQTEVQYTMLGMDISEVEVSTFKYTYVIQPAIKYYHLKEACHIFDESRNLDALTGIERKELAIQSQNDIYGRMTENIVISDVKHTIGCFKSDECELLPKYDIKKVKFDIMGEKGEIDMIIWDVSNNVYYAFEIKHTKEIFYEKTEDNKYEGQVKHLKNELYAAILEKYYTKRVMSCVLYNGNNVYVADVDVYYLNIAEFLILLDDTKDLGATVSAFTEKLKKSD